MLETKKQLREIIETKTKQIHARDKIINEQKAEIKEWRKENKELRYENEDLTDFKNKIISIMSAKGSIVEKYDKIDELARYCKNS